MLQINGRFLLLLFGIFFGPGVLATGLPPPLLRTSHVSSMSAVGHLSGCGYPGSYLNSKVSLQQPVTSPGDVSTHFPIPVGSKAVYWCEEPYIILGDPTRVCQPDFTWSGGMPFCGLNVAMHKPITLPADRFAWLTNDGIISTRARDCYAHSSQAGATFTWKMDLTENFQIHSVRILALADFAWSANVTVQTVSRTGAVIDVHCGKIDYTGSDQTAAVSLPCRKIVPVRWISIEFSLGGGSGRLRLCEVNVLAIDALSSEFCPQEASAKAVVGSSCLSFHSHGRATWGGALQTCRKLGGTLIQSIDKEEQTYLQGKLQYLHRFQPVDAFYWIGLFRSVNFTSMEDHWLWTTGFPPSTTFWAANQPDSVASKQFCTGLSGKTSWLWNDFNCESGQGFWICRTNFTSCPIPEQPANGLVTMLDRRLGGLVSYRCEEGFELIGVISRACQSSGTWSGLLPRCLVPGTQPASPAPSTPEFTTLVTVSPTLLTPTSALNHVTSLMITSEDTTPVATRMVTTVATTTTLMTRSTTTPTTTTSTTPTTTMASSTTSSTTASSSTRSSTTEKPTLAATMSVFPTPLSGASIMVRSSGKTFLTDLSMNSTTSAARGDLKSTTISSTGAQSASEQFSYVPLQRSVTNAVQSEPSAVPSATLAIVQSFPSLVPFSSTMVPSTSAMIPIMTPEYFAPVTAVQSTSRPVQTAVARSAPTTGKFLNPLLLGLSSPRCRQVPMVLNGHYTVDMFGPMLVARYSCNPGFNLIGVPFLTCTPDGSWRGIMPLCLPGFGGNHAVPTTTKIVPTESTKKFTTRGITNGDSTVAASSKMVPSNTVQVRTGTPSSKDPDTTTDFVTRVTTTESTVVLLTSVTAARTTETSPKSTTPMNRSFTMLPASTIVPMADLPDTSTYFSTTTLLPTSVTGWSSSSSGISHPHLRCPPLPLVEYAETLFHGQKVMFRCLPGYSLIGSNTTSCLRDGTWDSFPECLPIDCEQPEKHPHGMAVLVNNTSTYGSLAAYTCNGHLVTHGIYYRICAESGRWEGPVPDCSSDLPALPPAESRQDVQQAQFGLMNIVMGVVGTVGALTILIAVTLSVRWIRKQEVAPQLPVSPTMYSLSSEHSPRALMTERSSAKMLSRARYVPSSVSNESGYEFDGSVSHASSTQAQPKRNTVI